MMALAWANLADHLHKPVTGHADRVVIDKTEHMMTLYTKGQVLQTYRVSLGRGNGDAKQQRGDHETPVGLYAIDARNAHSRFHLALHISYPNAQDREHARELGVPAGGDIMIHAVEPQFAWLGRIQSAVDWTDGCIAVTDRQMDEVWALVNVGTPVEIRP